jgi:hypothetical protein
MLFMATWLGAVLFSSGDAKRTLANPSAHLPLLRDRMARSTRVAGISALGTVLSGFGLIFVLGGFGSVSPGIHVGLVLSIVLMGIGGGFIGRNWKKIEAGLDDGKDAASLAPFAKQMSIGAMIFHTLWFVVLVLMVFRAFLQSS